MRILPALLTLCLLAAPALAEEDAGGTTRAAVPHEAGDGSKLDTLFSKLKHERNEAAAQRIADRIWRAWTDSGSATAGLLMQRADEAMKAGKFNVALDLLDQVIALFPNYAEGWNRRATVHYMMKDYARSMADIARTLKLEPRHFGALSGMAGIFEATGHDREALETYRRILEVYPMMRSAQAELAKLSDALAGEGI